MGYVDDLIKNGIEDPVAYYKQEVFELNKKRNEQLKQEKNRQISEDGTPEKLIGYFPVKSQNDSLGVKKYIDLMQTVSGFQFSLFSLVSALVYARIVLDLCQYFGQKKLKDYAVFSSSSSSFCWGVM